jgi:beta-glucosidase
MSPFSIELEGKNNDRASLNGNIATVSSLVVTCVDRDVQEDARRAQWNGQGAGLVAISTLNRQVLSDYLHANSALIFDVKVDTAPQGISKVRIGCGPSCYTEVDLTEQFTAIANQGWKTIKVDLVLFPDAGTDFGLKRTQEELFELVLEPFGLFADNTLDLVFSNVRIEKNAGSNGVVICN